MKQLERGLGKVLFIDEAYRLGEGAFAQEAVNELVDNMTKPKFAGKLVIILAGYDKDMNNLLRLNEGLGSRFADEIIFPPLGPEDCLRLLEGELQKKQVAFPSIHDEETYQQLLGPISELSKLSSWGNARDVQTLAKSMIRAVFLENTTKVEKLFLPVETALSCIRAMLSTRRKRDDADPPSLAPFLGATQSLDRPQSEPRTSLSTLTATKAASKPLDVDITFNAVETHDCPDQRDPGVSDAIWNQLQRDKKSAELRDQEEEENLKKQESDIKAAEEAAKEAEKAAAEQDKNEAERMELMRQREEARIRELKAKDERDRIQREQEQEAMAQKKLRKMGVCVAGFKWIKQSGGYRCAGGTHYVSDEKLGI